MCGTFLSWRISLNIPLADVLISFEEAQYTVQEESGLVSDMFCVQLCGVAPKRDFAFIVDVMNGSATGTVYGFCYLRHF